MGLIVHGLVVFDELAVALPSDDSAARELAAALLERGERPSAVAKELAGRMSMSRNRAYELVQSLAQESEESE